MSSEGPIYSTSFTYSDQLVNETNPIILIESRGGFLALSVDLVLCSKPKKPEHSKTRGSSLVVNVLGFDSEASAISRRPFLVAFSFSECSNRMNSIWAKPSESRKLSNACRCDFWQCGWG